jgi:hypothetical protein
MSDKKHQDFGERGQKVIQAKHGTVSSIDKGQQGDAVPQGRIIPPQGGTGIVRPAVSATPPKPAGGK